MTPGTGGPPLPEPPLAFLRPTPALLLAAAACAAPADIPAPGVDLALATRRSAAIHNLRYELRLELPAHRETAVRGEVTVRFDWNGRGPVVLDFRAHPDQIRAVRLDGDSVPWGAPTDHIVVGGRRVARGEREITVAFTSGDDALNRQDDFLYALFVPDRASTAVPLFEQPDLKARWTLTLELPEGWASVSNGAETGRDSLPDGRARVRFAETEPISTYLFAFAAGRLSAERAERDGRALVMYHRETDSARVARNRDAIFDLHAGALRWLEEYTGIPYPFGKFAFVAIPAFQFGGMEHPGAIWYRAESLFLDPAASRNQELGRASLIAHETAHMWFGDLVTMRWFNDVWMKEVFANFMAAKIAGPAFPDLNLDLRFFQAHHPAAYGVDRTAGANAIRQPLENQRDAGSLYGAIIYQKAPIVMRHLEDRLGADRFRDGLRVYLDRHRFGNADWPALVGILDSLTPDDLTAWSRAWVEEPGRPEIRATWADSGIRLTQHDHRPDRALRWPQRVGVTVGWPDAVARVDVVLEDSTGFAPVSRRDPPAWILAGSDGVSYGRFVLDSASRSALLTGAARLDNALLRAVAWQTLWEELLAGALDGASLLDATLAALMAEQDELVLLQLQGQLRGLWWRHLTPDLRTARAPAVEALLWRELGRATTPGRKGAWFSTLQAVTISQAGLARLERIWRGTERVAGLPLTEQQFTGLAEALAVRGVANADAILDEQERRITNPDRRARLRFLRPALSADPARRDSLFRTFAAVENRRRESWVLDAMGAIHHPLSAEAALPSLRAALELTEEIQRTGDIFFPLRWLNATLDGHTSAEAARILREYLGAHPDLPPRLRGKVLQAGDELLRASQGGQGG